MKTTSAQEAQPIHSVTEVGLLGETASLSLELGAWENAVSVVSGFQDGAPVGEKFGDFKRHRTLFAAG